MPSILCDVMRLMSAQRHMCATIRGALSENVATVSLRTEQCLDCSCVSVAS